MQFCRAGSIDEAVAELEHWGDDCRVLAGGTDLMLQFRRGEVAPGALVHIGRVEALRGLSTNGVTRLGALATHSELGSSTDLCERHPALVQSARTVGGWQTQAVGTLGGNICNGSPAADTIAPLLVAGAQVELRSARGDRRVDLEDFLVGRRTTVRAPDELLVAIEADPLPSDGGEVYLKVGRRGAMDVAIVGLAVRLRVAEDGVVSSARVALCSAGPVPFRATGAESMLVGSRAEVEAVDAAGVALVDAASPIDDGRATARYRSRVLSGLLARAVSACIEVARSRGEQA